MASNKRALGVCDQCGFAFKLRTLKRSSYGTLVCYTCFDGAFDLQNHPQNKTPDVTDDENLKDPRPERIEPPTGPSIISIGFPYKLNLDTGEVTIDP